MFENAEEDAIQMTGIRKWMRLEQSVFSSMQLTHSAEETVEYKQISKKSMEELRADDERWARDDYFGPAGQRKGVEYMRDLKIADHVNAVLVGLRRLDEKLGVDPRIQNEGSVVVFSHDRGKVNLPKCRELRPFAQGESLVYSRKHSEESCRMFAQDCPEWLKQEPSYQRIWDMIYYHHRPWNANPILAKYVLGLHVIDWTVSQVFEKRIHHNTKPIERVARALATRVVENVVLDRNGNSKPGYYDRFNKEFREQVVATAIEVLHEMAESAKNGSGTPVRTEVLPQPAMALAAQA